MTTTTTTRLLPAPLYAVSEEWEHNGYDDSDFYRTMYDPNTDQLRKVETWTTRFGCGYYASVTAEHAQKHHLHAYQVNDNGTHLVPLPVTWFVEPKQVPDRVWTRAEQLLADRIFELIKAAEQRKIITPEPRDIQHGTKLLVVKDCSKRAKKNFYKTGMRGEVFWSGSFGTFYRNGYNHPNAENTSVGLRLLDSTRIFVPLSACQLDKPLTSDNDLRSRANSLARNRRFEQCWGRVY